MTSPLNGLIDSFGRVHNNLRISVTDRCNIRCVYCMPESVQFLPRSELLSFEEIERFVRIVAPLGVDKLRLTGGEPLVRRELHRLVERLRSIEGISDIGLTTNGLLLAAQARDLRLSGLERLNVSLDTLDPGRFEAITRRPGLDQVVAGIHAAQAAGFTRIKVNAVAVQGLTEPDVVPLARFCRQHHLELRFIEYMPLDAENRWERDKVLLACRILEILAEEYGALVPASDQDPRAPALEYIYADNHPARVGIIASVSRPSCASCNRLRLTAEGKLRNCLFALTETDIRGLLRGQDSDEKIAQAVRDSVAGKWEGHEINTSRFLKPERLMHAIGG
jgi:cyclic pyranopterin phosphate synthase